MKIEQLTYTACTAEMSYDGETGFGVKDRSAGITDGISRTIVKYCDHRNELPKTLENIIRELNKKNKPVTSEIITKLPSVFAYYQVDENLFAMTKTSLIFNKHDSEGNDQALYDSRLGKFFAHTFVFHPEALEPFDYNPFALPRSDLFLENDTSKNKTLPTLQDFKTVGVQADSGWKKTSQKKEYARKIDGLLAASVNASDSKRSVLLSLNEWNDSPALLEALLRLLPSEMRCRMSFCTYTDEPRGYNLAKRPADDHSHISFNIIATAGQDELISRIREGDYFDFMLFNFAEKKFSQELPTSLYSSRAVTCLEKNKLDDLKTDHSFINNLGADLRPELWEKLVPISSLPDWVQSPGGHEKDIQDALPILVEAANEESAIIFAADLIWTFLTNPSVEAKGLINKGEDAYRQLHERLPRDNDFAQSALERLKSEIRDLVRGGRYERAQSMLRIAGNKEEEILANVFTGLISSGWPESAGKTKRQMEASDTDKAAPLLVKAFDVVKKSYNESDDMPQLVISFFEAADQADCLPDYWKIMGSSKIRDLLGSLESSKAAFLADKLLTVLSPDSCPEGCLAVGLWKLGKSGPSQSADSLISPMSRQVLTAMSCSDPESAAMDCIETAQKICEEGSLPVLLAAMYIDLANYSIAGLFLNAFKDAFNKIPEDKKWGMRNDLAERSLYEILADDFLNTMMPWPENNPKLVNRWMDIVIKPNKDDLLPVVCKAIASKLNENPVDAAFITMAKSFMDNFKAQSDQKFLSPILETIVLQLPLEISSIKEWKSWINQANSDNWKPEIRRKLIILRNMETINAFAEQPDWTPAKFSEEYSEWTKFTATLDENEREILTVWLLSTFPVMTEIYDYDVAAVVEIVRHQTDQDMASKQLEQFLSRQTKGRDLVSQVLVLKPFALRAIQKTTIPYLGKPAKKLRKTKRGNDLLSSQMPSPVTKAVGSVLSTSDRAVRTAFWDHIQQQNASNEGWGEQLTTFRNLAEGKSNTGGIKKLFDRFPGRV